MLDKHYFIASTAKKVKAGICFSPFFMFSLDKYDFYYHNILSVSIITSNAFICIEAFKNNFNFSCFPERKLLQLS